VKRLQQDYFAFMCWFYMAPLMRDLRNAALREDVFSFDQPMFAVLYGTSNCGKTSLVDTLMASMFSYPRFVETRRFTSAKVRGLQQAYRRFPVVFDDVARNRFNAHADEIIKDENIPCAEYPCVVLSMNSDARSLKPEIIKRCLMIYTRTALPGDNTTARRELQRSVAKIREGLTTALYRVYLKRIVATIDSQTMKTRNEAPDALELSSSVLRELFLTNLPKGTSMPKWCGSVTLSSYQKRAFERPRSLLISSLDPKLYDAARRPPQGCWNVDGNRIILSVAPIEVNRTRKSIPDWLLDDTARVSGQIALDRKLTEEFIGQRLRKPRRWLWRRA